MEPKLELTQLREGTQIGNFVSSWFVAGNEIEFLNYIFLEIWNETWTLAWTSTWTKTAELRAM